MAAIKHTVSPGRSLLFTAGSGGLLCKLDAALSRHRQTPFIAAAVLSTAGFDSQEALAEIGSKENIHDSE
jgi:hypothetical protein